MHFDRILWQYELAEVLDCEFLKSEEAHIRKHSVKHLIISIGADRVQLVELTDEDLEEVLVPNASIEHLLDEDLLIGVLDGRQVVVCMWVNRADDWVEGLDALLAVL